MSTAESIENLSSLFISHCVTVSSLRVQKKTNGSSLLFRQSLAYSSEQNHGTELLKSLSSYLRVAIFYGKSCTNSTRNQITSRDFLWMDPVCFSFKFQDAQSTAACWRKAMEFQS